MCRMNRLIRKAEPTVHKKRTYNSGKKICKIDPLIQETMKHSFNNRWSRNLTHTTTRPSSQNNLWWSSTMILREKKNVDLQFIIYEPHCTHVCISKLLYSLHSKQIICVDIDQYRDRDRDRDREREETWVTSGEEERKGEKEERKIEKRN